MHQSNTFDDEEEFPYTIAITYILSNHFLINPRRSDRGVKLMVLVFSMVRIKKGTPFSRCKKRIRKIRIGSVQTCLYSCHN